MDPLGFFQGSELHVTEAKVYKLIWFLVLNGEVHKIFINRMVMVYMLRSRFSISTKIYFKSAFLHSSRMDILFPSVRVFVFVPCYLVF